LLQGKSQWAHPATQAIGYELSGNLALFKGDMKLVKNLPPVGDGLWHLHDLSKDPGETTDLQTQMPELFKAMQSDYETYAKSHGVLPMPDGYNPTKQVFLNSMTHYWLPTYGAKAFLLLCASIAAAVLLIARKRKLHA
jgi:arylsulfatase A-like enzyme